VLVAIFLFIFWLIKLSCFYSQMLRWRKIESTIHKLCLFSVLSTLPLEYVQEVQNGPRTLSKSHTCLMKSLLRRWDKIVLGNSIYLPIWGMLFCIALGPFVSSVDWSIFLSIHILLLTFQKLELWSSSWLVIYFNWHCKDTFKFTAEV
jgi:hypothetical protein